ncbi:hypothetical protein K388_06668 [Streptomyces sp. KhCrAH-43]|uniref:hypothetical protein n=1 Tax=unclassified Streptomyces TaxID=2593676 RepID=UPI00037CD3BA|nr:MULTISPECIES: hypothetical protein [unclassified Streptomyces]MYS33439.1 hypothetical protein [Streptomyces sp. SID4920]MYX65782.1 hypothetical protein [Streptomyces sp. SID8373]RAJ49750.1 hypothetical protein K388_06668 [Streptomyces sp. KhCrAH-43]
MSEQPTHLPDDFRTWLAERGQDAYALVWVAKGSEPTGFEGTEAPRVGESGIARAGADLSRITSQDVTQGRAETLRRWLQLDDGGRHLAILTTESGTLREHTPGELAAELLHDPAHDEARLTEQLAGWFYRRNAEAQQGLELGWIAAAAAWTCHMRALASYPPPSVLTPSLERAGELDEPTADLVVTTGLRTVDLIDRLERPYRTRTELIEDWHAVEPLVADVPALAPMADWLLDQIALRDASAQQLRAVLEPDLTDYLRDRRADGALLGTTLGLDAARAAHLAQARDTVRAYTAAAHSGRESEARQLLDAFPIPARDLSTSGPAATWRENSATAADAVEDLAAQRAATGAEDSTDYLADPELLHAATSYLAAREAQLHLRHDALGRLAFPAPIPRELPEELAPVAAAQTQRRVIEAFGTLERATEALEGQLHYQLQQPVPAHRRATTDAESDLLNRALGVLEHTRTDGVAFDEADIRARLQEAMARPAAGRPASTGHDEAQAQALAAAPAVPGMDR